MMRRTATGAGLRQAARFVTAGIILISLAAVCSAQQRVVIGGGEGTPATDELKASIVDSVSWALQKTYVFPDVAQRMEDRLREKLADGAYDAFDTIEAFAHQVSADIRETSGDGHLRVYFESPESLAEQLEDDEDPEVAYQRAFERGKRENFRFKEAKILDGNVGYLKLDGFVDTSFSGPTAVAAMNFLGYTDALIIDLRENGGGSPSLIQTLMAYLLEEPTHINSFYIRDGDSLQQFWSAPYVPGPRMVDTDLYVLTSEFTFSAAEEFTYNVKNLERGTIVGETTGGGAHPVKGYLFPSLNVGMRVSFGRAINPISGTNWEGTGVAPDIEVPAGEAFDAAYLQALRTLRNEEGNDNAIPFLDWAIAGLEAKLDPVDMDEAVLTRYVGDYGPRHLRIEDGHLVYQRDEREPYVAIPMTETLFRFEELAYFRLEVVLDDDGNPVKLIGRYDDGHTDENPRD
jgi:hypothetical protein